MTKANFTYKITVDDLNQFAVERVNQNGKHKKRETAFLKHIQDSKFFKEVKKNNKKYTFLFKNKYENELNNLKKQVRSEYDKWEPEYFRQRNIERIRNLEKKQIPINCSKLKAPKIPKVDEHEQPSLTCKKVLNSILFYCGKFQKIDSTKRNIVENIIYDVYIKRLGNFCIRAYDMLGDDDPVQRQDVLKKVVAALCYGNDINIRVGLAQISTRLGMFMNELTKAEKISDPEQQSKQIKNILNEMTTTYPESKKYAESFVEGRFVEFRRTAKVFSTYLDNKLAPALSALADILIPLSKLDGDYVTKILEEEKQKKEKRQKGSELK